MTSSRRPRIVAIGECMAELSPAGPPATYRQGFAGDSFNTAWYLACCGAALDVAYASAIGEDRLSQELRRFIRESGVDDRLLRTIPGGTLGLYLVSLDQGERSFTYWRGQSAARRLAEDADALRAGLAGADLIYFSGITLAILSPQDRAILLDAVAVAGRAGARVAFDPNLRPALWHSPEEMTETVMQAAGLVDLALPSFEDEARWFGDASPAATRARYLTAGPCQVVVKNGADPILWQDGAALGETAVAAIAEPVDTTAAGDSLNAGVLASLATGGSLEAGIALGCRFAAHVVRHRGALVPLPDGV
ncbi:sugar kinase [Dinoroseobacter sp. S124A]|uniref:sugar kinase n=1 Tax=Dinoroseobacter sp. S124A TaxID=3415128 RepID=UPI003C7C4A9F